MNRVRRLLGGWRGIVVVLAVAALIERALFLVYDSPPPGLSPLQFADRRAAIERAVFAVAFLAGVGAWWIALRRVRQVAPTWHAGRLVILVVASAVVLWLSVQLAGEVTNGASDATMALTLAIVCTVLLASFTIPIVAAWEWFGERKLPADRNS